MLYLCKTKGRLRAGAYVFLTSRPKLPIREDSASMQHNAAIHIICKVIDAVMLSAQEAKMVAGFITAKVLVLLRQTLEELGYA